MFVKHLQLLDVYLSYYAHAQANGVETVSYEDFEAEFKRTSGLEVGREREDRHSFRREDRR